MPFVIPFFLKVILGIFLFQLALLWLALPFAIYGIKKRMQVAKEQRDELLQELFWLRKTVETIPGASGVARRHSQQFMLDLAEKQKAASGDEETGDGEEKQDAKAGKTKQKAGKSGSDVKTSTAKKPAKKIAAKKSAEVNRDNEPQISVPKPAASLVDGEEYAEEEEDPEEDYPDIAFEGEAAPKKKAKKKAMAAADGELDDSADIEDDSLDYMDDDSDASHMLIGLPTKSSAKEKAQAMTNMVVEIPEEDEINENEEGFFVYRGKKFEHLLDAMKQQQDDAQKKTKAKAS